MKTRLFLSFFVVQIIVGSSCLDPLTGCAQWHVPDNFGKTHFILGFPDHNRPAKKSAPKPTPASATDKQVFFAPDDDIQQAIIGMINSAQSSVKVAIFSFTDQKIADALIAAHQRGVKVEVITDPAQFKERYSKVTLLQKEGIKVLEYNPNYVSDMRSNLMHHKFAIIDTVKVITGSFNWTVAAQKRNQENLVVLQDAQIVTSFDQQFDKIKGRCVGCEKEKSDKTTRLAHAGRSRGGKSGKKKTSFA